MTYSESECAAQIQLVCCSGGASIAPPAAAPTAAAPNRCAGGHLSCGAGSAALRGTKHRGPAQRAMLSHRHAQAHVFQHRQVDVRHAYHPGLAGPKVYQNTPPRIDDEAVPVALPLLIVLAHLRWWTSTGLLVSAAVAAEARHWQQAWPRHALPLQQGPAPKARLCSRDDKALRLDGPRPQQHLPVRLACRGSARARLTFSPTIPAGFCANRSKGGATAGNCPGALRPSARAHLWGR